MNKNNIVPGEFVYTKDGCREATHDEYVVFLERYFQNTNTRDKIFEKFEVEPYEYFDLAVGSKVFSSLQKGDHTCESIVVIKVTNNIRRIYYYIVFPSTVGKKLLKKHKMSIPQLKGIRKECVAVDLAAEETENAELCRLLLYMRAMDLDTCQRYHHEDEGLRNIYNALVSEPNKEIDSSVLFYVNEVLKKSIEHRTNRQLIKVDNVIDYVEYLHHEHATIQYINGDFSAIHHRFVKRFPKVKCYF